jgi:hypothetical protein
VTDRNQMATKEELTAMRKRYRLARTFRELFAAKWKVDAVRHAESESRLETSSYPRALQGKPIRSFAHFARHQIVAAQLPLESYFRVT